jgi:hypothetical protein
MRLFLVSFIYYLQSNLSKSEIIKFKKKIKRKVLILKKKFQYIAIKQLIF